MDASLNKALQKLALEIRIGIVEQIRARGFGHIGGSLSIADALAVLYGKVMRYDPQNPRWPERDKLVCSKGHAGPAVYAALAISGFFPYEELKTLNQPGTHLPSHCDKNKTPGVDMTTGSLGQGTSLAVGIALGDKLKGRDSKTYLFVGDGESDEGQVWEAAMFTAAKRLTNIVWLVDDNKKQLDGYTQDVLPLFDLAAKFAAFGFDAQRVDGNDVGQVYAALTAPVGDKPRAIILDTVKGKGIPEVENTLGNHSMTVAPEVCDKWLAALNAQLAGME
ncbi:MAG TPA: transketolase [Candidatus Faecousia faecigallinarum]|nr:transketolase [Candidatus Faecousia faecigallinarum]